MGVCQNWCWRHHLLLHHQHSVLVALWLSSPYGCIVLALSSLAFSDGIVISGSLSIRISSHPIRLHTHVICHGRCFALNTAVSHPVMTQSVSVRGCGGENCHDRASLICLSISCSSNPPPSSTRRSSPATTTLLCLTTLSMASVIYSLAISVTLGPLYSA